MALTILSSPQEPDPEPEAAPPPDGPPGGGPPDKPPKPNPSEYTRLKLAFYTVYTRRADRRQYVAGEIYKFPPEKALELLEETDCHLPVWEVEGKPPKP